MKTSGGRINSGGAALIMGNIFHQSAQAENVHMISYGNEGFLYAENTFHFINNTAVNERNNGTFFLLADGGQTNVIENNILVASTDDISFNQKRNNDSNIYFNTVAEAHFKDWANYDYRLTSASTAIDQGITLAWIPEFEYVHPLSSSLRSIIGAIDVGAYEYEGMISSNHDIDAAYIDIYPNPVAETFFINTEKNSRWDIYLYNTLGLQKTILHASSGSAFHCNDLVAGHYFLVAIDPLQRKKYIARFIKK